MSLFLETVTEHGDLVAQNGTNLAAAINDTTLTVTVDTAIFSDADTFVIGEEEFVVASGGDTTTLTVTRSGTKVAHANNATVRAHPGTELITKTFNGSESLTCIRFGGEIEAHYVLIEQVGSTYYYCHRVTTPDELSDAIAAVRQKPASGTIFSVQVWTWASAVFFAEIQS